MQNLEVKFNLKKIKEQNLQFWATIISFVENRQSFVRILSKNCNFRFRPLSLTIHVIIIAIEFTSWWQW